MSQELAHAFEKLLLLWPGGEASYLGATAIWLTAILGQEVGWPL